MKAAVVVMLFAVSLAASPAAAQTPAGQSQAATKVCTLKVSGLTCEGCGPAVKIAAKAVDGVKNVKVNYDKANATVTYNPLKTTPEAIAKAITDKTGFKAEAPRASK